jgi:hypothetical protein
MAGNLTRMSVHGRLVAVFGFGTIVDIYGANNQTQTTMNAIEKLIALWAQQDKTAELCGSSCYIILELGWWRNNYSIDAMMAMEYPSLTDYMF